MTGQPTAERLDIVAIGASGDLARKKIIPALFALHCQGYLPGDWRLFGFARSTMTDEQFRERIAAHLTCRYAPGESCGERMNEFLARCRYVRGRYESRESMLDLYQAMTAADGGAAVNRLYYLAIPPGIVLDVAHAIGGAGLVACGGAVPWSRVVVEKPFGRDRASSDELIQGLSGVFPEEATFRIDHYLGKEVIQNLLVLRFANLVFEPVWNRQSIQHVEISWKEDLSVAGRGGYFDDYGIIRDVMQNHLLQILALVAMEPPARVAADCICREKCNVLRAVQAVTRAELVTGQYRGGRYKEMDRPAYREDPTVPPESRAATYAAAVLRIDNDRWRGVPFLMRAGKGLDARMTEIRIRFKPAASRLFAVDGMPSFANTLVIRVQPEEGIYLSIANKRPGLGMTVASTQLDLQYHEAFPGSPIPDAYENLLLDVLRGDKSLFIRRDELSAAWDVFTPVLHALDAAGDEPDPYPFGSRGPAAADALAARHGAAWS